MKEFVLKDCVRIAELLYPNIKDKPDDYEKKYPMRDLPKDAFVTRFAPSPTGSLHIGNLIGALLDEVLAHQTGGVSYLRIEDTDKKREIEGAVENIIDVLGYFDIKFDEGVNGSNRDQGVYGPYKQSMRGQIYQTFVKHLIENDYAYPCFCTEGELAEIRKEQEKNKANPGYYGDYTRHRNFTYDQVKDEIEKGKSFVVRLKSRGDFDSRIELDDAIRGQISMPENIQDAVILKSDGIPTYHFAHAIDDHLMRTTHVVRGEEWLSSVPLHFELFKALGFEMPQYVHISPVMKIENQSKRKLSKRKDPEAALTFYKEEGYPSQSVREYLLNLLNSSFEEWRMENLQSPTSDFIVEINKMSVSGSVFDLLKFQDTSKDVISRFSADQVYEMTKVWASEYDQELSDIMNNHEAYTKAIINIERGGDKPRKDIVKWADVRGCIGYFYDNIFAEETTDKYDFDENLPVDEIKRVLEEFAKIVDTLCISDSWFSEIKAFGERLGYAPNAKKYKKNPELFRGHVGDVMVVVRVAIANRRTTPNLQQVMNVMGQERVQNRLKLALRRLDS